MDDSDEARRHLLDEWNERLLAALEAHYDAASIFQWLHKLIAYSIAVASTVILVTSLIGAESSLGSGVAVPIIAAIITGVSIAQAGHSYAGRAETHRLTAARYASIKREIEQIRTFIHRIDEKDVETRFDNIRIKIDNTSEQAPSLPRIFYYLAKKRVKRKKSE